MSQPIDKILIAGPQGSGKGTQAEILSKALGIPTLSMGQLLRDEISAKTETGNRIESVLAAGALVPEELPARILEARLQKPDVFRGYILDGFPRSYGQLKYFDFDQPTHMLVLNIPREESLNRLVHRLTCSKCGDVVNMLDGREEGETCACGGHFKKRKDDTAEAIGRRLDIYEKDTKAVIDHYAKQGIVREVDGVGSIPEVAKRVLEAVRGEK